MQSFIVISSNNDIIFPYRRPFRQRLKVARKGTAVFLYPVLRRGTTENPAELGRKIQCIRISYGNGDLLDGKFSPCQHLTCPFHTQLQQILVRWSVKIFLKKPGQCAGRYAVFSGEAFQRQRQIQMRFHLQYDTSIL